MRGVRAVAASLALGALLGACGGGASARTPPPSPSPANVTLPDRILGLRVAPEDIAGDLTRIQGSYLDSIALFGLREGTILRASLQVGRFNHLARPEDPAFRAGVVSQFGTSEPQEMRLGDHRVWLSAGKLQYIFLWFAGDSMYVLTERRDYSFSRSLLRRLVEETNRA